MTEEEEKMLDIFKQEVEKEQSEYEQVNEYTKFFYNNHKFILNLIQKQQEEIECHIRANAIRTQKFNEEIEKKDKIIDEMANYIVDLIKYNNSEEVRDIEEIKQYFEKKVEDKTDD